MVEFEECKACPRVPYKCCGGSISTSLTDAIRIVQYLDIPTFKLEEYFYIDSWHERFEDVSIKSIEVDREKFLRHCVFLDPETLLCKVHEVKPEICANYICSIIKDKTIGEELDKVLDERAEARAKRISTHTEKEVVNKIYDIIRDREIDRLGV